VTRVFWDTNLFIYLMEGSGDLARRVVDLRERMLARRDQLYTSTLTLGEVLVKPKEAVLDPQGNAVRDAMRHLGMPEVRSVRIGKYMEINVEGEDADLEKRLHRLCRDLLSNPVIEDYELVKTNGARKTPAIRKKQK